MSLTSQFTAFFPQEVSLSLAQFAILSDFYYGANIFYDSIGALATKTILFRPPDISSEYRIFAAVEINGDQGHLSWTYEINKNAVSDTGTPVLATTRNLENISISRMAVSIDPTVSLVGASLLNRGMTPQDGPKSSANPFAIAQDFFRLSPNNYYIFQIKNRSTSSAGVFVLNFKWFEFRPNIGFEG